MDVFDRIPDSLILLIFNSVADIKTLIQCRAVCKRFNTLVPQTETLLLKVDCVVSPDSDDANSPFVSILKSILKTIHNLVSPKSHPIRTRSQSSPSQILLGFQRIRNLQIELPSGDLKLEKKAVVKWRAEFGKTLRSCVIFGFREIRTSPPMKIPDEFGDMDFAGGLKLRVVWTINALIAASARHYLLKEVVKEHREVERVELRDKEGEGSVVMEKEGLREFREGGGGLGDAQVSEEEGAGKAQVSWERNGIIGGRTTVPSVKMRMRHVPKMELKGDEWVEGATLVVVRPTTGLVKDGGDADMEEDVELALDAFGEGVYGEVVRTLVHSRSYLLEMNSF